MNKVLLIARRSFTEIACTKSTIITSLVIVIVMLAAGGGIRFASERGWMSSESMIVLEPGTSPYASSLRAIGSQPGMPDLTVTSAPSAAAAEKQVKDGDADYALIATPDAGWELVTTDAVAPSLELALTQLLQSAKLGDYVTELGGNTSELAHRMASAHVVTRTIGEDGGDSSISIERLAPVLVIIFFVFLAVTTGSATLAMGVIQEKASRIIEVIISTVSPLQLVVGKVLGLGCFVLAQTLLYMLASLGALALSGFASSLPIDLPALLGPALVFGIVGYFIFSFLYAAMASTATRMEDSSAATGPMTLILVVCFYVPFFGLMYAPGSTFLTVCSMLPIVGCFTAPAVYAVNQLPLAMLAMSFGIQIVSLAGIAWVASRVYARQILHFGTRMSVWKALRHA
ncbi:ABC transporter permease [Nanchangia anserum]|uniref:ABC transporter permease n=1 Tax=Nanchangia anserum TaxID=2692125 RepID=A0A8I0GDM4_9ACTO|nr:ABC transporter permease [Nanchangia anserum]MBD3689613.1 ABC transporter permease [Nanchangia anserum]QOX81795.1 ABC transporter permease [Nanchangia anserum]